MFIFTIQFKALKKESVFLNARATKMEFYPKFNVILAINFLAFMTSK